MAKLFEPFTIRDTTAISRVIVSPMCMYSPKDGVANDFHFVHLRKFPVSRAGLVTAAEPKRRIKGESL
jgi:2,4-dienoyl-CoA reductase-like NADH-dependent reductase (Old Yellow Enzyme family)